MREAKKSGPKNTGGDGKSEVDALMAQLDHPLKAEIEIVRALVLGASPEIAEGVKWNAPSFRRREWFATFHLRPRDLIQLIFHRGAKIRDDAGAGHGIEDPAGLLEWLGNYRATVKLTGRDDIEAKRSALEDLVRQWILLVP